MKEDKEAMDTEELRRFALSELKTKRSDITNPDRIVDFMLSQPFMQSREGVEGFLKGYKTNEQ